MKVMPFEGDSTKIVIVNTFQRYCVLAEVEQLELLKWFHENKMELCEKAGLQ